MQAIHRLRSALTTAVLFTLGSLFPSASVRGEFQEIARATFQPCSVPLPSLAKTGLRYTCQKWIDTSAALPQWSGLLDFQFQKISKADWQILKQIYGTWHNSDLLPTYQPQRDYSLLDFLPPLIQALDRHRFITQTLALPHINPRSDRNKVMITANCWGTTYEILRLAHQPRVQAPVLFATAAHPMREILYQNSEQVEGAVKPGDLLLISHQHGNLTYLDHSAIAIDDGVFFEKAGSGDHVPYRLVDLETVKQIWRPDVFNYEYRRLHPQASFPHPQTVFSLQRSQVDSEHFNTMTSGVQQLIAIPVPDSPTTFVWMQQLPRLQYHNHRYHLAPSGLSTIN